MYEIYQFMGISLWLLFIGMFIGAIVSAFVFINIRRGIWQLLNHLKKHHII